MHMQTETEMWADWEGGQEEGFPAKFVHVLVTSHFLLKMGNSRMWPLKTH